METKINKLSGDTAVLYVHGKGGSAAEAEHYKELFPDAYVEGLDYQRDLPWETNREIQAAVFELKKKYSRVILIANSIGAYYSMNADISSKIQRAFFISPMVDMEGMIANIMTWANVSEEQLEAEGTIKTDFGEDLSWEYLRYVREHPVCWKVPTDILYGSGDHLMPYDSVKAFAEKTGASLTVMDGGEHWFHTDEQMSFLDQWLCKCLE